MLASLATKRLQSYSFAMVPQCKVLQRLAACTHACLIGTRLAVLYREVSLIQKVDLYITLFSWDCREVSFIVRVAVIEKFFCKAQVIIRTYLYAPYIVAHTS